MKVITLCGSTRFKDLFDEWNMKLTLQGNCVFSCGYWNGRNKDISNDLQELLDKVHREKISISNAIFVINKDGYIGKSTKSEIEYAKSLGKEIMYLEN